VTQPVRFVSPSQALVPHDPRVLRAVTSLVAPPLCALCGDPCDYPDSICGACDRCVRELRATRIELPSGLEVISAAPYEGVARELVTKMKFASRLTLAEVMAERMIRAWGATREGWTVPVPPAPARERVRGYDVAYALARLVAQDTWAQVAPMIERDDGPRQVGRPRGERIADPPRVRLLSEKVRLSSDDLWLVDDVVTTGATLDACAAVLRAAGATRVRALTFARADTFGPRARAA
jgi:predicted amidophosphoribosyltransferase